MLIIKLITANPNRIGMKLTSCLNCFIKLPLFSFQVQGYHYSMCVSSQLKVLGYPAVAII